MGMNERDSRTLKLIGEDKNALLLLDKDLATRVFNAPVIG